MPTRVLTLKTSCWRSRFRRSRRFAINARTYSTGTIRKTAVDGRTTRHKGYEISQRCRKRIEESFGWAKTIGGAAKLKLRGLAKAKGFFTFRMIAYNLIRIPKLLTAAA